METIIYPAKERGFANHGWLQANHSFSFASWYHPDKIHFGALRVLNDDRIAPSMGFGRHPHDNMEIITIPLSGSLKHQDSMGHSSVIQTGEVQVMSAGTGIQHAEFNASTQEDLTLFQIWIFPNKQGVTPRYDQISYTLTENEWVEVVGPEHKHQKTWIHQNAWISLGKFSKDTFQYTLQDPNNGCYLMVIDGEIEINGQALGKRDAIGIVQTDKINIVNKQLTQLLVLEVPLQF